MDKNQVIDFVDGYGFSLWAIERGGEELHFMEKRYGINLWVGLKDMGFRFEWMIPHSVFSVKCPQCTPLTNKEHFEKMLKRFKKSVRALYWEEIGHGD